MAIERDMGWMAAVMAGVVIHTSKNSPHERVAPTNTCNSSQRPACRLEMHEASDSDAHNPEKPIGFGSFADLAAGPRHNG